MVPLQVTALNLDGGMDTDQLTKALSPTIGFKIIEFGHADIAQLSSLWGKLRNATAKHQLITRLVLLGHIFFCLDPAWLGWL